MADERLNPIRLSSLPEIETPEGFWIFGSKEDENGVFTSGRYSLESTEDYIRSVAEKMQLERRIQLEIQDNPLTLYLGEETTVYKVKMSGASKVTITLNGVPTDFTHDVVVNYNIAIDSLIEVSATPSTTDTTTMYVYIFAKAVTQ